MPIVTCANCGTDLVIDEPNGVAYITHEDGTITCAKPIDEDVPMEVTQPEEGEV